MKSLEEFFAENPRAAIAFSGGADSAYLLYAALKYARSVTAYFVMTPFQPYSELEDALRTARILGARLRVLLLDPLADPDISQNTADRCYFCKRRIFLAIAERAAGEGCTLVLDGTNASDDAGDRPGMRALEELSVLSPLRICGLSKADIRSLSQAAGLPTWDKPSNSCLAARIAHGTELTLPLLSRTEKTERFLAGLGFSNFRVRTDGDAAIIQVTRAQTRLLDENMGLIEDELLKHYSSVGRDPEARHEQ